MSKNKYKKGAFICLILAGVCWISIITGNFHIIEMSDIIPVLSLLFQFIFSILVLIFLKKQERVYKAERIERYKNKTHE